MSFRTMKFTFTGANGDTELLLDPSEYTTYSPNWEKDSVVDVHPFTGKKSEDKRGHYFTGTIDIEGMDYDKLVLFGELFDTNITNLLFYPNADLHECFPVMIDGIGYEDYFLNYALGMSVVLQSTERYDTPLNPPYGTWGDRLTRMDSDVLTFSSI